MSENPANLALRFLLELAALAFFAVWGWHLNVALPIRYAAATLVPLAAAVIWGAVATSRDVVRATSGPIMVSGAVRLTIELLILGCAALCMYASGYPSAAVIYAAALAAQSALSWDRWKRLLS